MIDNFGVRLMIEIDKVIEINYVNSVLYTLQQKKNINIVRWMLELSNLST